jgi:hypothetical protein
VPVCRLPGDMRLPKRPVDPALTAGAPLTPSSSRVHPELASPSGRTPVPRRLPPLGSSAAETKRLAEPEPEPEPEPEIDPITGHHPNVPISPGEAARLKTKRIHEESNKELFDAFQVFDLDGNGANSSSRALRRTSERTVHPCRKFDSPALPPGCSQGRSTNSSCTKL